MRFALRFVSLALMALLVGVSADAAALKARAVTDRAEITLGDLWADLPEDVAQRSVMPAPAPGQKVTIDAVRLAAIAEANRIDWISSSTADRVVVERTGLMIQVPVPLRPISQGEIIRASDLGFQQLRADRVNRMVITETAHIVGKTAKRALAAVQPVRANDLGPTLLVAKNSLVTVKLNSGKLVLVMQGKALDDGAAGEAVRVLNTRSNKIIQGMVSGPGTVTIDGDHALAVN